MGCLAPATLNEIFLSHQFAETNLQGVAVHVGSRPNLRDGGLAIFLKLCHSVEKHIQLGLGGLS